MPKVAKLIILFFFLLFSVISVKNLSFIPLHDFDEANRAEAAKNMKRYQTFIAPLTGSPFLRNENLKVKAKNNPSLNLYYHLERPPLYFLSMVISTSIFGENELGYRLPSFIFGILTILISFFISPIASFILLLSSDWWLSSQSALMDTMLSFFMFLSFLLLIKFIKSGAPRLKPASSFNTARRFAGRNPAPKAKNLSFIQWVKPMAFWCVGKKNIFLIASSLAFSLAFFAKGQPVLIFIFPLVFSLLAKKIDLKNLLLFITTFFIFIFPWLLALFKKFGLNNFINIFLNFAKNRALTADPTQKAPFFWYARWWLESFRVGWIIFLSLFIYDLKNKKLNWEKSLTLFYFFASFFLFSFSKNKVWWYVLPLVPIIGYYISQSFNKNKLINFSLIIFISGLPIFYGASNKISLLYGTVLVIISFFILNFKIKINKFFSNFLFILSLIFSLIMFYFRFPYVKPNYPEVKKVGEYYQKLLQPKCLYVENMPYESALFYTDAEEINYLTKETKLLKNCLNYLLTPNTKNYQLIYKHQRLNLYQIP